MIQLREYIYTETYFEKLGTNEKDCLPTDIDKKLRMIKSDLNYAGQRHLEKWESTGIDCVRNEIMKQCLNNSSFVDTTVTLLLSRETSAHSKFGLA